MDNETTATAWLKLNKKDDNVRQFFYGNILKNHLFDSYKALIHHFLGIGIKVLPMEWTGIALILRPKGMTSHKSFELPLDLTSTETSFVKLDSDKKMLRRCETPPSPPTPDPVGIENCKQLFSPLLAFTTQKIATHCTDIISAVCVAFFWVVKATRNEKSCLQFLIPTAVFYMLLR